MQQKVLLVEDSVEVQLLVKQTLSARFAVVCAATSGEAIEAAKKNDFDLFLIDVPLPDEDGFHLCAKLRNEMRTAEVPLIFLTAKTDIRDKVLGFSLGADDYISKPFDPLELRARVEAKLKKKSTSLEVLTRGNLKINIPYQKAFLLTEQDEQDLDLTPNEFRMLYYFVRHEGHVISREQLLDAVWGQNVNVLERTVDTHIYTLRKKLSSTAKYIESVFGAGYRFSLEPAEKRV